MRTGGTVERQSARALRAVAVLGVLLCAAGLVAGSAVTWLGLLVVTLAPVAQLAVATALLGLRGERRAAVAGVVAMGALLIGLVVAVGVSRGG